MTGSAQSPCYASIENDHCASKDHLSTCSLSTCPSPLDAFRPRHIHLALAGSTGMRVAWKTCQTPTRSCKVDVARLDGDGASVSVAADGYVQYLESHGYHHAATLKDLAPGAEYSYRVSCDDAAAEERRFNIPALDLAKVTVAVIGDMGTRENGKALKSSSDFLFHVGDIGYADDDFLHASCTGVFCYEAVYDQYMEWMENITDSQPYMVMAGNHESECHSPNCLVNGGHADSLRNFSAYNARWRMPSQESGGVLSMWYSFDYGPVHFVAVNTETDFPDAPCEHYGDGGKIVGLKAGGFAADGEYLRWLEADLAAANANRAQRPFVVTMGHRSWIVHENKEVDAPVSAAHKALFEKYGVDLHVAGHMHSYSRHLPINNNTATPIVVSGAAGCDEGLQGWDEFGPAKDNDWDYYGTGKVYQVGTLEVTRESLTWKALASETGEVFDSFSLPARSLVV